MCVSVRELLWSFFIISFVLGFWGAFPVFFYLLVFSKAGVCLTSQGRRKYCMTFLV